VTEAEDAGRVDEPREQRQQRERRHEATVLSLVDARERVA
jgi:hypothetical protein